MTKNPIEALRERVKIDPKNPAVTVAMFPTPTPYPGEDSESFFARRESVAVIQALIKCNAGWSDDVRALLEVIANAEHHPDCIREIEAAFQRGVEKGRMENRVSRALLHQVDETICEVISGNQGSFVPEPGTVTMASLALRQLRRVYPVADQTRDLRVKA